MKVYGEFCWGGTKDRAEVYFIPAGSKPDPQLASGNVDAIKQAVQSLVQQNLRGSALEAGEAFVTFQVPDEEKLLEGNGDNMVARIIVYDNGAHRLSGHDDKTILTLKAAKKPFPILIVAGAGGAVLVFGLLLIVIMRGGGGGGRGKRAPAPPPAPVVAGGPLPPYGGGGYGPPPGGYGPPPPYGGAPPYGQGPPGGFAPNPR
jgi:hypothetical protein